MATDTDTDHTLGYQRPAVLPPGRIPGKWLVLGLAGLAAAFIAAALLLGYMKR